MKRKWKIFITIAAVLVAGAGVYASTVYSKRGVVTVQTGRVVRQDLTSLVTASGEIKPKNYINIGANAMGDITEMLVKEGDHVRKGQLLAKIEDIQPEADVEAQKASLASAEADSSAAEAGLKAADENMATMQAAVDHDKADLARMKADFDRAEALVQGAAHGAAGFRAEEIHLRGADGGGRQESETRARAGPGAARADRRPTGFARSGGSPWRRPTWRASTTFCRSTIPSPRSMAWSPTCRCARANRWCPACRTRPAPSS